MNIGFDLDGVLYPWHQAAYDYMCRYHSYEKNFRYFWTEETKNYDKLMWDYLLNNLELYTRFIPDVIMMNKLSELDKNNTLFYITGRPESARLTTERYLKRFNFPQHENFTVVTNFNKLPYIVLNEIEYYFEDRPEIALSLKDFTNVLLINQPWNEDVQNQFHNFNNTVDALDFIVEKTNVKNC